MKDSEGFTLIEVLVTLMILSIILSVLYGTFSGSAASARIVEEKADEVSVVYGAMDVVSREIRGGYVYPERNFKSVSGDRERLSFITTTPLVGDGEPLVRRVSYEFDEGKFLRKTYRPLSEADVLDETLLVEGVKEAGFFYFDGREWIEAWPHGDRLPRGIKTVFSHNGKVFENVIPIWSGR